ASSAATAISASDTATTRPAPRLTIAAASRPTGAASLLAFDEPAARPRSTRRSRRGRNRYVASQQVSAPADAITPNSLKPRKLVVASDAYPAAAATAAASVPRQVVRVATPAASAADAPPRRSSR